MDQNQQQPLNLTVQTGGGGGGFFSRLVGAIIASCFISFIGYFSTYTTLFARFWLTTKERAKVEMPAEKKARTTSVAESTRSVLGDAIGKIKEQLAKTKDAASSGIEKAKDAGATFGKKIERKVDKTADELKKLLAQRQEAAKKKHDEEAKQLAEEKAKYEARAAKFREFYDAMCPNQRCRAPLNLKIYPPTKVMHCVRCRTSFKVYQARLLGRPEPPPFRSGNRSIFGGMFGR